MRQGARRALKIFGILLGVLVLYIVTAAAWAHTVTPAVIARASRAPLTDFRSLPDSTREILLRVEDPGFRKHKGIDLFTPGQGRVTITRSLAQVLYLYRYDLSGAGGIGQKVFRFVDRFTGPVNLAPDVMAVMLNRRVSKDRQLRLYMTHVYMGTLEGQPIYGFANAARVYFGKKRLRDMSRRYVVVLVGMMVGPDRFHPIEHPDALGDRTLRIERLLRRQCRPRGVTDVYYADCAAPARQAASR
jgi:membrane carboxypeptidase/penicillin-binding protein